MTVSGPRRKWLDCHLRERAKPKDHPFLSQSLRISTVNDGFRNTSHPLFGKKNPCFHLHLFFWKKTTVTYRKRWFFKLKGHEPPRAHLKTIFFWLRFKLFNCIVVVLDLPPFKLPSKKELPGQVATIPVPTVTTCASALNPNWNVSDLAVVPLEFTKIITVHHPGP